MLSGYYLDRTQGPDLKVSRLVSDSNQGYLNLDPNRAHCLSQLSKNPLAREPFLPFYLVLVLFPYWFYHKFVFLFHRREILWLNML